MMREEPMLGPEQKQGAQYSSKESLGAGSQKSSISRASQRSKASQRSRVSFQDQRTKEEKRDSVVSQRETIHSRGPQKQTLEKESDTKAQDEKPLSSQRPEKEDEDQHKQETGAAPESYRSGDSLLQESSDSQKERSEGDRVFERGSRTSVRSSNAAKKSSVASTHGAEKESVAGIKKGIDVFK